MNRHLKHNDELKLLVRHRQNKLTSEEQKNITKAFERDTLLAEAYEGISTLSPEEVIADLDGIDVIHGKISNNRTLLKPTYIGVAALLIVLIIVVLIFLMPGKINLKLSSAEKITDELTESELIFTKPAVDEVGESAPDYLELDVDAEIEIEELLEQVQRTVREPVAANVPERPRPVESGINAEKTPVSEELPEPNRAIATQTRMDISIESPQLDISPMSLAEPIQTTDVVEAAIAEPDISKIEETTERINITRKAVPIVGLVAFEDYVSENMVYPPSEERQRRQIVQINFTIDSNSRPSNFSVVRAPSNPEFQSEAIRLLNQGPTWLPALNNGEIVDEVITYRFVFRP